MKKRSSIVLSVFAIQMGMLLSAALGQEVGSKIGFVNTLAILQQTAEGRQELSQMEAYQNEKRQAMQTQSEELLTLRQQYDSQARMLNPQTAAEMEREIESKDRQLRRAQEDFEIDANRRQSEMLGRMSEKIQTLIAEYAEQNGFGVIFLQSPQLPYFSPALDISADIIKVYDERNPVGGSETAPPSEPAPATTQSP